MNIEFRNGVTADIPAIERLEHICFSDPWSFESIRQEIEDNDLATYRVILVDGQFAGYCGFWVIGDECGITNVAIDPAFRGLGLGTQLVSNVLEDGESQNLAGFTLEVRVSNQAAIGLYEKLGFKNEGIRPGYYMDGEDAMIMWLWR